ncbi:hypothetical protein [Glaciimonas immobilis]|uniref:Uncharacterized protein n=1 Tax=Glaciimonas immobilis TaxID=728004 RepID=A0A840S1K9_9BURK|nr:hypothetical protein [Glaciimonas immobilis]KAF3996657.1 hypothetical protein HAV38_18695 [Glaciimonas immobilis]MBB5202500.1 hypothetical protein [Glaciimonas immobilis]
MTKSTASKMRVKIDADQMLFSPTPLGSIKMISLIDGRWSMVNGQWSMVNGQWSMVNGQWSMVNGQ